MAIKVSGPLSFSDVVAEFGGAAPHSLSEYYRGGGLVPNGPAANASIAASGAISLGAFYGAVRLFVFTPTISEWITNYNVRAAALAAGWDGSTPLAATITNNGVIGSNSTGAYAFDTDSGFPAGSSIALINNYYITGRGGDGGTGGNVGYQGKGGKGGPALLAQHRITITNNGTIGGGGGGGGGTSNRDMGAGGSGGAGYPAGAGGSIPVGAAHGNIAGNPGTTTAGGASAKAVYSWQEATGGAGGALGGTGGTGSCNVDTSYFGAGGEGGAAVVGNANITWVLSGTRLGSIS